MLQEGDNSKEIGNRVGILWRSTRSSRFDKGYSNIRTELQNKADEAIQTLIESERPDLLGDRKTGPRRGCYTWSLGRQCRILYYPIYADNLIKFLRICSHKQVYQP